MQHNNQKQLIQAFNNINVTKQFSVSLESICLKNQVEILLKRKIKLVEEADRREFIELKICVAIMLVLYSMFGFLI